ncbi:MAG: lipoyl(octanoyl) transferase LipB [Fluviicoccus sp.]|nr:lipoyl(octanoyl) transferase LipB [Fluviicoccus sp.]MDO8331240.1 lipoyl(octanoyl) transferase LipB [Fluviicoccus sp.]
MLIVRHMAGDFQTVWQAMRDFTDQRTPETPDELWFVEHPPVFTLGQAGKTEHILAAGDIPVVKTDRGGQVTYHGPGQLVGYCLFDLRRTGTGVRDLVEFIEDCLVDVLQQNGISARADRDAHGVYVGDRKIASLGLRIRRGCSYHGFALNVDMDLEPFNRINPCGYTGLQMTSVHQETPAPPTMKTLQDQIRNSLEKTF